MILNKAELIEYFHTTKSVVETNFPKFAASQLKQGYLIIKYGKGQKATYEIKEVEPQEINKQVFSSQKQEIALDEPGEIWKTTYCSDQHEVSNLGRIRNKNTRRLINGSLTNQGYLQTELQDQQKLKIHRIVLQTFNPIEDFENMTVDHINGIRSDNRLENLRWATEEENVLLMLKNRKEITRETTRLISKYGYDKTLELIRSIQ